MIAYNKPIDIKKRESNGYEYFLDREHPLSDGDGYVFYHRHVISLKIGKWITKEECVHHIDGNRGNNCSDNLMVLTRSEHASVHKPKTKENIFCGNCGKEFYPSSNRSKYCSVDCAKKASRRFNPTREELLELVWRIPTSKVAKLFEVSDNAIAKRCKKLGINKPPRGYWAKKKSGVA